MDIKVKDPEVITEAAEKGIGKCLSTLGGGDHSRSEVEKLIETEREKGDVRIERYEYPDDDSHDTLVRYFKMVVEAEEQVRTAASYYLYAVDRVDGFPGERSAIESMIVGLADDLEAEQNTQHASFIASFQRQLKDRDSLSFRKKLAAENGIELPSAPSFEMSGDRSLGDTTKEKAALQKPEPPAAPDISEPVEPVEPVFPSAPVEPEYRQPGFLNKRKVEAENERLRREYGEAVDAYKAEKARLEGEYAAAVRDYEADLDRYRTVMAEYAEAREMYGQQLAEYRERLAEIEEEGRRHVAAQLDGYAQVREEYREAVLAATEHLVGELEASVGDLEAKHASMIATYSQKKADALAMVGEVERMLQADVEDSRRVFRDAVSALESLYACGRIYPKYRAYPVVATMAEYLETGRCPSLEGADGAYNLYESELRADRVIATLENIDANLDEVKGNQYLLFTSLNAVAREVSDLVGVSNRGFFALVKAAEVLRTDTVYGLMEAGRVAERVGEDVGEISRKTATAIKRLEDANSRISGKSQSFFGFSIGF